MPKASKRSSSAVVVDSSDSDSGPEDRTLKSGPSAAAAAAKKPKVTVVTEGGMNMVEGEPTWELGYNKKLKIRQFKGRTFIDIREWYVDQKTMETKPGKKGISLSCEQYQALKAAIPEIDRALP